MIKEEDMEKRRRIERHMQNKIDYLKSTLDGYEKAIDKCEPARLSSYSWTIATQIKDLKELLPNLTKSQEKQFDSIQKDYIQQFDRLKQGHCQCKPSL